jgi:hypothetical protein
MSDWQRSPLTDWERDLLAAVALEPEHCECGGPWAHVSPCDPGEDSPS